LTVSGIAALGCLAWLACGPEDTDPSESPLVTSVARQLVRGPSGLYGPFGGDNPLVLIHAPLYYRLAALVAYPLRRPSLDAMTAALISGRSLSFLSMIVTLFLIDRLSRIDGADRRAGWWAAGLFASSPILGGLPVAVRPDAMGVLLQSGGVLLVFMTLAKERPGRSTVLAAYAVFGLALCVKQHYVAAPAVSTILLLAVRRRLLLKSIGAGILLCLGIVLLVYGVEEIATDGWMSRSILIAASQVPQVHPANWRYVEIVLTGLAERSFGLVAVFGAVGLAAVGGTAGWLRKVHWAAGTGLLAAFAALWGWHDAWPIEWLASMVFPAEVVVVALMLVPSALIEPRNVLGNRFDAALWAFLAAELGMLTVLSRASMGAWYNYAMQAVFFGCVLTARALSRSFHTGNAQPLLPVAAAALLVPTALAPHYLEINERRQLDRAALNVLFQHYGRPHDEFYFADRPGDNRVFGRRDLVFDEWLYPVFERSGLAEPRASWLKLRLLSGPVTVVVYRSRIPIDIGIRAPIQQLGFTPDLQVGPLYAWQRVWSPRGSSRYQVDPQND
jgi:hypothetical protein